MPEPATLRVKPRSPELKVMDPATGQFLDPDQPTTVPNDDYWRRLRDTFGDVVEVDGEAETETTDKPEGEPA
jgi:hypothetical protein